MANHNITAATSILTAGSALVDYAGGTLAIEPFAYLHSTGGGPAVDLAGSWSLDINGGLLTDDLTQAGLVISAVFAGDRSTLSVGSNGYIAGGVGILTLQPTEIANNGTIAGNVAILESTSGDYTITNSGRISAFTSAIDFLGGGTHLIVNTGIVEGPTSFAIRGGLGVQAGSEIVTNSGDIVGDVWLGDGNDTFTNFIGRTQGTIAGVVDMGGGDDIFRGGLNDEVVHDGAGADRTFLGGGNDTYVSGGTDALDIANGGKGVDTYDASGETTSVYVNLDRTGHADPYYGVSGMLGLRAFIGSGIDSIVGFENVSGGSASDVIYGNKAANHLAGNHSGDDLWGLGGNDLLEGGSGGDYLIGGLGADTLSGGSEGDRFILQSLKDSTVRLTGRDTVTDFIAGTDRIDLSLIDANTTRSAPGDDAFVLAGGDGLAAFSGTAGELRVSYEGPNTVLYGDVNGDARADFAVTLLGLHTLAASDFIL